MKTKNKLGSIILSTVLIIYAFILQFFIVDKALFYVDAISAAVMMVVMFIAILIYGFKADRNTNVKNTIFYRVLYVVILYFAFYFGIGFFIGYAKSPYSLGAFTFFYNVVAPIVIILCAEVYRYTIINSTNRYIDKYTTFALIVFEFFIGFRYNSSFTLATVFKISTLILLPIVLKNIVLSKLTRDGGLRPILLYRLATEMFIYITPLMPRFNDFIASAISICLPLILYASYSSVISSDAPRIEKQSKNSAISDYIITGICILSIVLVSGVFPVTIVGVASNSMVPKIFRGDAVVYRKVMNEKDLKVGDIIVYKREDNDKTIIHRIVKIENNNGEVSYVTKGDANNGVDPIGVKFDNIKGKYVFKIKYIAYPSIYLSEMKK